MAADDQRDDELDEAAAEAKPKGKSNLMKIILIVVGVVVLLAVNIGVTLMLVGGKSEAPPAEDHAAATDAGHGGEQGDAAKKDDKGGEGSQPVYFKLDPTFVVNFQAQDAIRFLQVSVEVMARDQKVIAAVEQHMPIIRNNLILLFSSQDFTTISTRVGKERLRAQVLAEIQKVLKENIGKPGVEAVFFTSFVMQ